jgi:hypothetical protein
MEVKKNSIVILFVLSWFFLHSQNESCNKCLYKLCEIDSTSFDYYYYLKFKKSKEDFHLLILKEKEKEISENFCYLQKGRKYCLSLDYLNIIKMKNDGQEYELYIFQIAVKFGKNKIGGSNTTVYTTDLLYGLKINCDNHF